MNCRRVRRVFRRGARAGVVLLLACALLNLSAPASFAAPTRPALAAGEVTVAGGMTVDGSPAVSGQTLFPGSTIRTADDSASALGLGNLACLELSGGTTLRLDFTDSAVGGSLDAGRARLFVPSGVEAHFKTADASITSARDAAAAAFTVAASPEGTRVSVQAGRVEVSAGGAARTVSAGEVFATAGGGAAPQSAGQNLSGGKRAGLFVGIAVALVAIILAVTRRDDEETPPKDCPPVLLSGTTDVPC